MFGYIRIYEPELKMKDFRRYKAYYCGLCQELKKKYGAMGQMTLTYDMTFVLIFLHSLYESPNIQEEHRCKVHPVKRQRMLLNEMTGYCADMNILMSYYHLKDDWEDDRKKKSLIGTKLLQSKKEKLSHIYERQSRVFEKELKELSALERESSADIDRTAGCFGRMMGEMLAVREDVWAETLRRMGFYLGKFIYIMDAYEDLKEDQRAGRYNPLKQLSEKEDYEERMRDILCMMMGECSAEFEKLPCLLDIDILRNILYDGVWNRYRSIQEKEKETDRREDEKNNDEKSI